MQRAEEGNKKMGKGGKEEMPRGDQKDWRENEDGGDGSELKPNDEGDAIPAFWTCDKCSLVFCYSVKAQAHDEKCTIRVNNVQFQSSVYMLLDTLISLRTWSL